MQQVSRLLLGLISGFGTFAGLQLSGSHLQTGETCPVLGPVPACYLVAVAYALILMSAVLIRKPYALRLFLPGWVIVFGLAASGVALELSVGDTCPAGPRNIPQCFFSLSMAMACAVFFILAGGLRRANADNEALAGRPEA